MGRGIHFAGLPRRVGSYRFHYDSLIGVRHHLTIDDVDAIGVRRPIVEHIHLIHFAPPVKTLLLYKSSATALFALWLGSWLDNST